jgi:hypothetical protein
MVPATGQKMKTMAVRKKKTAALAVEEKAKPLVERRRYERVGVPAAAFALDVHGNEMGRVVETSGGGMLLDPASPWARLALVRDQQLMLTIVEPATGNMTDIYVEVRRISEHCIGLRFL